MKTVKILMIATLLVLTTASITNADGFKEKPKNKTIHVTLVQAIGIPGLAASMFQQLNQGFLGCGCQSTYTVTVTFQNVIYIVTGTEREWKAFFKWGELVIQEDTNLVVGDN